MFLSLLRYDFQRFNMMFLVLMCMGFMSFSVAALISLNMEFKYLLIILFFGYFILGSYILPIYLASIVYKGLYRRSGILEQSLAVSPSYLIKEKICFVFLSYVAWLVVALLSGMLLLSVSNIGAGEFFSFMWQSLCQEFTAFPEISLYYLGIFLLLPLYLLVNACLTVFAANVAGLLPEKLPRTLRLLGGLMIALLLYSAFHVMSYLFPLTIQYYDPQSLFAGTKSMDIVRIVMIYLDGNALYTNPDFNDYFLSSIDLMIGKYQGYFEDYTFWIEQAAHVSVSRTIVILVFCVMSFSASYASLRYKYRLQV